jgi:hypothetical protein
MVLEITLRQEPLALQVMEKIVGRYRIRNHLEVPNKGLKRVRLIILLLLKSWMSKKVISGNQFSGVIDFTPIAQGVGKGLYQDLTTGEFFLA